MRIVFIGTGEIGVPTLRALQNSEHELVGVVTQPDKPVGREQKITAPPVKKAVLADPLKASPARTCNRLESKIAKRLNRSVRLGRT